MSEYVKSKRTKDPEEDEKAKRAEDDDDTLPDVAASTRHESSSIKTTPKPAPSTGASPKITMADIKQMMAQTARDITLDLNTKHQAELQSQHDAVTALTEQVKQLKEDKEKARMQEKNLQPSPFETPKAARPQDLAYQQIRTTSKMAKDKDNVNSKTPGKTSTATESITDTTLQALVKLMTNSSSKKLQQTFQSSLEKTHNGNDGTSYYDPIYKLKAG